MPIEGPLTEQWLTKLRESQRQLEDGSERLQWVRRVYIRVYRFLLGQYGKRGCDLHDNERSKATSVGLTDNLDVLSGKPPKSETEIRAALNSVHASIDRDDLAGQAAVGLSCCACLESDPRLNHGKHHSRLRLP